MSHVTLSLLFALSLFQETPGLECEDHIRIADSLRVLAVDEMDRSESVLAQLASAARDASSCFVQTDLRETARWYSYELWSLYSLRQSSYVLERIEDYEEVASGANPATDAIVYTYQGGALTRLSRLDEAFASYHRALASAEQSGEAYRVSTVHVHLTELARRMNRVQDVFHHLDRADSVAARHDFPERDYIRSNVAFFRADALVYYESMGPNLSDEAREDVLTRVDDAFRWASSVGDTGLRDKLALVRNMFRLHTGDSSDVTQTATSYYVRHIEGHGDRSEMTWLNLLSNVAIAEGDAQRAMDYLLSSYSLARDLGELEYGARLATRLGNVYESLGDLDLASTWYLSSDATFERHLREGGGSELHSAAYSRTTEPLRSLAFLMLRQGKDREAFQTIERARSQLLAQFRRHGGFASDPEREHADSLATLLREVRAQRALGLDDELRLLVEETRLQVEVNKVFPEKPEHTPVELSDLQAQLARQGQVLLSYLVAPDSTPLDRPFDSYLFIVTRDTIVATGLDFNSRTIGTLIGSAFPHISGDLNDLPLNVPLDELKRLYDLLIAPARPFIQDGDRLIITPDGPLFRVPFAALVSEHGGRYSYADARYLIEDHAISTELSAALLLDPGGSSDPRGTLSVLSRSQFSGSLNSDAQYLADLPWVAREARSVRRTVRGVQMSTKSSATPATLFASLSKSGAVHVATHVVVDPASMLNHAIVLNPDSTRSSGVVYAFDLLRRYFGTSLVFLSACATVEGPMIGGEGLAGFQYSFRASGVGSVIATHWLVEDASMASISTEFYRNMTGGIQKDEALRRAQLALIESDTHHTHPIFWAAPVLYGDASSLPLQPARRVPWAIILFTIGAASGALIFLYLRKRTHFAHESAATV